MLAALDNPEETFRLGFDGGPLGSYPCRDFIAPRPEEVDLLDGLRLPAGAAILDYGCGIGRHLAHLQHRNQQVRCFGIEICDGLRDHCQRTIGPAENFVQSLDDLPPGQSFDLILMMGNGLGVLGDEDAARAGLARLISLLSPEGRLLIETGPHPSAIDGYRTSTLRIRWGPYQDPDCVWGCAGETWMRQTLGTLGCEVVTFPSDAPLAVSFHAVASRKQEPLETQATERWRA